MLNASLEVTVDGAGATVVAFAFTVENAGKAAVEVTFRDAGDADFAVHTPAGEELWRWSDGRAFAQVLRSARFEPGEAATFEATWPEPEPGDYTATAELRVREADVTASTPFSV